MHKPSRAAAVVAWPMALVAQAIEFVFWIVAKAIEFVFWMAVAVCTLVAAMALSGYVVGTCYHWDGEEECEIKKEVEQLREKVMSGDWDRPLDWEAEVRKAERRVKIRRMWWWDRRKALAQDRRAAEEARLRREAKWQRACEEFDAAEELRLRRAVALELVERDIGVERALVRNWLRSAKYAPGDVGG